jgi:hypothetical protein
MSKTNVAAKRGPVFTHEGATAAHIHPERALRRSIMACLLWEDTFYEDGVSIVDRLQLLVPSVKPEAVADMAIDARTKMKLRHAPLMLARIMARLPSHKHVVGALLPNIIQRADEIAEFLAIYWKDKPNQPLSAQVKKGLAKAFHNFSEFDFAKYDRDGIVKLRDALFLSHAKPAGGTAGRNKEWRRQTTITLGQEAVAEAQSSLGERLWRKIIDRTLTVPDTWEVALSKGADKKETFTRLMQEGKLGALAFLRNLRNMEKAGVDSALVGEYAGKVKLDRVLPFRFVAAARAVPSWEPMIERMMMRALLTAEKLPGNTTLVVDNSGSMRDRLSNKSDMTRFDAAAALAILLREICEDCAVIGFGTHAQAIPPRRGFALRDAIHAGPGGGTNTDEAVKLANGRNYDRIIVLTDEQSHTNIPPPLAGSLAYFVNVATYKNGIGYGPWTHIDGWSEAIIEYIRASESAAR